MWVSQDGLERELAGLLENYLVLGNRFGTGSRLNKLNKYQTKDDYPLIPIYRGSP